MDEKKIIARLEWALNRLELMGCKSYQDVQMIARVRGELIKHQTEILAIKKAMQP